jgi:hypothetical protein
MDPSGLHPVARQHSIPVEIGGTALDGRRDIAKPHRPATAVSQQMNAQYPEMVFGRGQSHFDAGCNSGNRSGE